MNYIFILGFANAATATRTLSQLEKTKVSDATVVILDQHWPMQDMSEFWKSWVKSLRGIYLDAGKNLGLHEGLNYMCKTLQVKPTDKVIGFDPDTYPINVGWDLALLNALDLPHVGWASLGNTHSEGEMNARGYTESEEEGLHLWTTKQAVVNSICAWNMEWIYNVGGFQEASEFYGGLECCMFPKCLAQGKRWVWLRDFREATGLKDLSDPEYKAYKWAHAHQGWKGDFAAWLLNNSSKQ
jgi:hypothetical protein